MDREPPPSHRVCLTDKCPARKMPSSSQYVCFVPKRLPLSAAPPDGCRHDHTEASGSVDSCDGQQVLHGVLAFYPSITSYWGLFETQISGGIICTVLSFPKIQGSVTATALEIRKLQVSVIPQVPLVPLPPPSASATTGLCSFPTVWLFPKSCIRGIVQCAGF